MTENIDLFKNFKNVFPGDVLTEEIELKNNFSEFDFIKVYLRAIPHSEEENPLETYIKETETVETSNDFLSQLSLKVYNGDSLIFSASPNEADGLSENTYIGTLKSGEVKTLRAELSVPLELGNDYQNRAGEVDWIFFVEGFNEEKVETVKTADTGFFTNETLSALSSASLPLFGIFLAGFFVFLVFRRFSKRK